MRSTALYGPDGCFPLGSGHVDYRCYIVSLDLAPCLLAVSQKVLKVDYSSAMEEYDWQEQSLNKLISLLMSFSELILL